MEPNFSGYVTKTNLKCADGRTIMPGAFKHQDGMKVPLVYQHNHEDINQVLGYAILSHKDDGIWGDAYLNETATAKNADMLVQHGDIDKFSIWAKNLDERGLNVHDGEIQEVSLVLAGANPGANISNVLMHSGLDEDDTLMVVGFEIKHADVAVEEKPAEKTAEEPAADAEPTVAEILATLTDDQRKAVNSFMDDVVQEAVTEILTEEPEVQHDNIDTKKGPKMTRNVFDRSKDKSSTTERSELKHDDMVAVLRAAKGNPSEGIRGFNDSQSVSSLRELIRSSRGKELMHADDYGIQNIEILFPDAQALMNTPRFVDRRQEWVKVWMSGTSHSPFSRVKTTYADITADEARARGYIKANQKVDEVFPVFKRTTGPTWIYKRQKLDRQDIIDIVDFDVVAWMKVEMRGKLDEEIARAGLFGDGRPTMVGGELNPDKIQDPGASNNSGDGIRAVISDNTLYATPYDVPMPPNPVGTQWNILLDTVTEKMEHYLGSGNRTAFVSYRTASKLLTIRDKFGHRMYRNLSEVAGDMDVNSIVRVPTELFPSDVLAIVLDLADYNYGTDRGGETTLFDDFDIDFNQYKYLMETYLSGALVVPYSAQIFKAVVAQEVVPTAPTVAGNVITIPVKAGVIYTRTDNNTTVAQGSTVTLSDPALLEVTIEATAANGYVLQDGATDSWTFTYDAG